MSADLAEWVSTRLRPEPWHSLFIEDVILGREVASYPSLNLVDIASKLGNFNVRDINRRCGSIECNVVAVCLLPAHPPAMRRRAVSSEPPARHNEPRSQVGRSRWVPTAYCLLLTTY